MTEAAWARRPLPTPLSDARLLGRWAPATPAALTATRWDLSARLHDGARPPRTDEGAVERLLLVYEELASNALRHGRPPVRIELTTYGTWWLLDVSDAAPDRPPAPAIDRDPAAGGLGLHLVARLCGARGWTVTDGRKHVWARIDLTRPEAPGVVRVEYRTSDAAPPLSPRELEVLQHLGDARSTAQIAAALGVSTNTVRGHVRTFLRKLSVTSRDDAVRCARELGLL